MTLRSTFRRHALDDMDGMSSKDLTRWREHHELTREQAARKLRVALDLFLDFATGARLIPDWFIERCLTYERTAA